MYGWRGDAFIVVKTRQGRTTNSWLIVVGLSYKESGSSGIWYFDSAPLPSHRLATSVPLLICRFCEFAENVCIFSWWCRTTMDMALLLMPFFYLLFRKITNMALTKFNLLPYLFDPEPLPGYLCSIFSILKSHTAKLRGVCLIPP